MTIRYRVGGLFDRGVRRAVVESRAEDLQHRTVDLAVERLLRDVSLDGVNDVYNVAAFLRGCVEPMAADAAVLREPPADTPGAETFRALLGSMRAVPPIPARAAIELALYADGVAGHDGTVAGAFTVAAHAALSSSAGFKGRLLAAAARAFRPQRALEMGTAYGIGTAFLATSVPGLEIVTIEGGEPQATIARESLGARYADRVHCLHGLTGTQIPEARRRFDTFDLAFHDAGHRGDDYRADIAALVDALRPGALFLIDDIRWDDRRFTDGQPSGAYEGWRDVAEHPRVAAAAELAGEIGALLLR